MPSESKAQQHLMGAAEHGADFPMAKKLRSSMSHQQLHEFASGSEKGKPEHVKGKSMEHKSEKHDDGLGRDDGHSTPHHSVKHTHIEHHEDGSHTVHHYHHPVAPPPKEEGDHSHAVKDLDELHDNLEEHLGAPNDGEGEEDGEQAPPEEGAE